MKVAIIMTVFNRIEKTISCLDSLFNSIKEFPNFDIKVYLTDDGSTDKTREILKDRYKNDELIILNGSGNLYWNGGMNNSWRAAILENNYDGYLWLNNDSIVYPQLWKNIEEAKSYSLNTYGKEGIYVGSTCDPRSKSFTYGGFLFINKLTLKDEFVIPNGSFQLCQAAHGNITYVASNVVESEGVFCDEYIHSGGDHDYTYLAYKHGFPVLVLKEYVGECENDHTEVYGSDFKSLSLRERLKYLNSPLGYNLKNTLLFQRRCFPYRYVPVLIAGYFKAIFPNIYFYIYKIMRS